MPTFERRSPTKYPDFSISTGTKDRLRQLELTIDELRASGVLSVEALIAHACDKAILDELHPGTLLSEVECKNLEVAYHWTLGNYEFCRSYPEEFIRELNAILLKDVKQGGGLYRTVTVSVAGADFLPPAPSVLPEFIRSLVKEIASCPKERSSLEFAVLAHTKLVWVHPFVEANGRTGRLLLNGYLLCNRLPVVIVNHANKKRYLDLLHESNYGDLSPLVAFYIDRLETALSELKRRR